ncbi:peroxisomal N(1)-acetyl-spermine/spermidine oxidase [Lampetra fluviatilis]
MAAARRNAKVVIVGCGIAGIAAAEKLLRFGFTDLIIVEATGRAGGRIHSTNFGKGIFEIGANWIHGPCMENAVFRVAKNHGLLDQNALLEENQLVVVEGRPPPGESEFRLPGGQQLDEKMIESCESLYAEILQRSKAFFQSGEPFPKGIKSIGGFVKAELVEALKNEPPEERAIKLAVMSEKLKLECGITGSHSMDDVDLRAFGEYHVLPGLDCTLPRGYQSLTDKMMNMVPLGCIMLNTPVVCIHWQLEPQKTDGNTRHHSVCVECEGGDKLYADHVLVTIPLGYLKKHHTMLFKPQLPAEKVRAVQKLGFCTNNKIFMEFEKPFWNPSCKLIELVWPDESPFKKRKEAFRAEWQRKIFGIQVLHPPERFGHVLCGWIAGKESEFMETLTESEVRQRMLELLRNFTGNPNIPAPKRMLISRWNSHPYTLGSYTYTALGSSGDDIDNLSQPLPSSQQRGVQPLQVMFAGEATHRQFYSTTHGALESGWREADRLIKHYSTSNSRHLSNSKL